MEIHRGSEIRAFWSMRIEPCVILYLETWWDFWTLIEMYPWKLQDLEHIPSGSHGQSIASVSNIVHGIGEVQVHQRSSLQHHQRCFWAFSRVHEQDAQNMVRSDSPQDPIPSRKQYLDFLMIQKKITKTRRTFDRALQVWDLQPLLRSP